MALQKPYSPVRVRASPLGKKKAGSYGTGLFFCLQRKLHLGFHFKRLGLAYR